jgi:SAM-dependent methyltransferase
MKWPARLVSAPEGARHAPATLRNRDPILAELRRVLPDRGVVLEIASGTGEHVAYFAARMPALEWQPSDADPDSLSSIAAWSATVPEAHIRPPVVLDVRETLADPGLFAGTTAIVNANMVHIAPWAACEGLMRVAHTVLGPGGVLFLYGPYRRDGHHTAPSNAAFDEDLRARDPAWGVRDLEDVARLAGEHGLEHVETVSMPANNLSVIFRRRCAPAGDGTMTAGRDSPAGSVEDPGEEPIVVPIEDALDLHPFAPRDIPSVVESYLEAASEAGFREVRLIHGRGKGVQRDRVRRLLGAHPRVRTFRDAPMERGGWGATLVELRG